MQDAGKQMQDMQLDAAGMKRRLVELHNNETSMVSEAVQLRTELARTQGQLARQAELTREVQASEAAMKARLSAEEKNNAALKAALDIQTQVGSRHQDAACSWALVLWHRPYRVINSKCSALLHASFGAVHVALGHAASGLR